MYILDLHLGNLHCVVVFFGGLQLYIYNILCEYILWVQLYYYSKCHHTVQVAKDAHLYVCSSWYKKNTTNASCMQCPLQVKVGLCANDGRKTPPVQAAEGQDHLGH